MYKMMKAIYSVVVLGGKKQAKANETRVEKSNNDIPMTDNKRAASETNSYGPI